MDNFHLSFIRLVLNNGPQYILRIISVHNIVFWILCEINSKWICISKNGPMSEDLLELGFWKSITNTESM